MGEVKAVEIRAEVRQIKTMADRTVNIILNLPEDCIPQAQKLMEWLGLEVGVIIVNGNQIIGEELVNGGSKKRKRAIRQGTP